MGALESSRYPMTDPNSRQPPSLAEVTARLAEIVNGDRRETIKIPTATLREMIAKLKRGGELTLMFDEPHFPNALGAHRR
jgi:hypothetical protein